MREANAASLERELDWLTAVIQDRFASHFAKDNVGAKPPALPSPPDLAADPSGYADFLRANELDAPQRLLVVLALAPMLRPETLDSFLIRNTTLDRGFTEFGGTLPQTGGFHPSVDTAVFLLAGRDLSRRFAVTELLGRKGFLIARGLIDLGPATGAPFYSCPLLPGFRLLRHLDGREALRPRPGAGFPAHLLETRLGWDDLVVPKETERGLAEILDWAQFGEDLRTLPGPARMVPPGYRSLFYGPPGTGKTLAASLLGKRTGRDVYQIDLSLVVSKWIGETEKNLSTVFSEAETNGWILFFDEADALFAKRTSVSSANDRYANQEVAYILQRIETFDGIVLLASNLKSNIDAAFARRFQSTIHFPEPGPAERLALWRNAFQDGQWLAPGTDLEKLAQTYELTGGAIVNALRSALLRAISERRTSLTYEDLAHAVSSEFRKEARVREQVR